MSLDAEFLAPRRCFLPPLPELSQVADLLAEAADALLAGNQDRARECLRQADMPAVHQFASRIMGRIDQEVHRYRRLPDAAAAQTKAKLRMPSAPAKAAIFKRDGYRCRYCGCRVVLGSARDEMRALLPDAIRWGSTNKEQHAAFFALTATPDHVVPHALGGDNDLENLVTACWPCNFGRNSASLAEMALSDPRQHPPVVDEWDGLGRMLQRHGADHSEVRPKAASLSHDDWFAQLDRVQASTSSRLLALLDGCRELRVTWRLNEILVVNMPSKEGVLNLLGIDRTGSVEVPWLIGSYKAEFRAFAHTLADAIPEARVYPTPHMWRVKVGDRNVSVTELLDAAYAVKTAFAEFGAALDARN